MCLNFIAQLGFLGNSQYPLWSLTVMALNIIVLYALTARWSESRQTFAPPADGLSWSRPSRKVRGGLTCRRMRMTPRRLNRRAAQPADGASTGPKSSSRYVRKWRSWPRSKSGSPRARERT